MKAIKFIIIILSLISSEFSSGQCTYQVRASSTGIAPDSIITICSGNPVYLTINRINCPSFSINDDFNNGILNPNVWNPNINVDFSNPCQVVLLPASGNVAWMGNSNITKNLITRQLDLSICDSLQWDMKYGSDTSAGICNAPTDNNEGVHLQYSTNGGTNWFDFPGIEKPPINYYGSINYLPGSGSYWTPSPLYINSNPYYRWNHYQVILPQAAKTQSTMIRFLQSNSSNDSSDHWGIDNFELTSTSKVTYNWSHGSHLMNPNPVYPNFDTWYYVTIIDSSSIPIIIHKDSVLVLMNYFTPTSTFTAPSTVCRNDTAIITYTGNASHTANFHWDFGQETNVLSGSGAGPYTIIWNNIGLDSISSNIMLVIDEFSTCASLITTKPITIYQNTEISFFLEPYPAMGCNPLTVNFLNQSIFPNQTSFKWDFGDGTTSNELNAVHTYQISGNFNVKIESKTTKGCVNEAIIPGIIKVYETPVLDINLQNGTLIATNYPLHDYKWVWNDSLTVAQGSLPYHIPLEIGYYYVEIRSIYGCFSKSNKILSVEKSFFYNDDNIFNNPTNSFFGIRFNNVVKRVEILNLNGSILKIFSTPNMNNTYSIDDLSKGMYLVKIYVEDVAVIKKIIKY
jgi:hypothetical protein